MSDKLKKLFKTLLLREEDLNHKNPCWVAKWIDIKVNLLSCPEVIEDIKKLIKEENNENT